MSSKMITIKPLQPLDAKIMHLHEFEGRKNECKEMWENGINYNNSSSVDDTYYVTAWELVQGYKKDITGKCTTMNGKLNIRPSYQREFVYGEDDSREVIYSMINRMPLGEMYWVKKNDGTYDLAEGQQRTISICDFFHGLSGYINISGVGVCDFDGLPSDIVERLKNYKLNVFVLTHLDGKSEPPPSAVLQFYKTINRVAKLAHTPQEIRNSAYTGTWLESAKSKLSVPKNEGLAQTYKEYVTGDGLRQQLLEIALYWKTGCEDKSDKNADFLIEQYMGQHRNDANANELIDYYIKVCEWVMEVAGDDVDKKRLHPNSYRWGYLYENYHDKFVIDREKISATIRKLHANDEVNEKESGFYPYIITGDKKYIYQRAFPEKMKKKKYDEINGICPLCGGWYPYDKMEGHHIIPWAEDNEKGVTTYKNLELLCKGCHKKKH